MRQISTQQTVHKLINTTNCYTPNAIAVNHIQRKQTRSLDENLLYLGSSLISFFTSFHCDVSVMSGVSESSR